MMTKTLFAGAIVLAAALSPLAQAQAGTRHRHHANHYANQNDNQRVCHGSGTTGLIAGGVAGGLAGNAIAGHGNRTVGTLLGATGGGLLGRSIDRHRTTRC